MSDDTDVPYERDRVAVDETTHPAPDGTSLAITVVRPDSASADDPAPLLLQRTPYGKPSEPPEGGFAAAALADGYAIAFEDTRGRGESDGEFLPWAHEGADGAATVDWLGAKPWVARVGMFGGSSPGQVQLFAAAERPDALGAIAPTFTPSDLHRSDFFQDGAMSALTFLTWALDESIAGHTADRLERRGRIDAVTADSLRDALEAGLERLPNLASHRPLVDVPADVLADVSLPADVDPTDVIPFWEAWTSRPTYDDFWRSFDPEVVCDEIAVPGLHTTGWYELCQHGTVTNFRLLSRRSPATQHLVIGPWAHQNQGRVLGDVDFGSEASAEAYGRETQLLAFFDTYLRDDPTPPFAPPGRSHVETFQASILDRGEGTGSAAPDVDQDEERDGAANGTGRWITHDDWPPDDARRERWFPSSNGEAATAPTDGRLSRDPPEKFEPADAWTHDPADPVPTRGGPLCCGEYAPEPGAFDRRDLQRRDDVLTFTTRPFEAPVELAGPVSVRLTAATSVPDTDFTATLSHVLPDGRAYNLCEGIRRVQYRYGRDRSVPIPEAGEPMTVEIDMWNVHYAVPAGGRLRLEVASSNFPRFDPHPGTLDPWRATTDEVRTAEQTLFHDLDRESVLTVYER